MLARNPWAAKSPDIDSNQTNPTRADSRASAWFTAESSNSQAALSIRWTLPTTSNAVSMNARTFAEPRFMPG